MCDSIEEMTYIGKPRFYAEGDGLQISDTGFIAHSGRCHYRVDNLFVENEPVSVWFWYQERHGVRRLARDIMANMDPYMLGREHEEDRFIADILNYSTFWWVLALAFLKFDRAFVHSGMVVKDGMGIVLSGTGGCIFFVTENILAILGRKRYYLRLESFFVLGQLKCPFSLQNFLKKFENE